MGNIKGAAVGDPLLDSLTIPIGGPFPMPKDLTKLSLKEFESLSNGDFDKRTIWRNGTLEMTVSQARRVDDFDADDHDE